MKAPMTPERLAEARAWVAGFGEDVGAWPPAELLAEVDRLRAQVAQYSRQCDAWADANDPIAADGGWQASGYMKAYRRVAEDLRALASSGEAQS